MGSELDSMESGECGRELGGAGGTLDYLVGGGEVIVRFRHVRHGRFVLCRGDFLPVPGVRLGNDAASVCVVIVVVLLVVVEGIGQLIHLLHVGIIQTGGAAPAWPGDGRLPCGTFGGRIRGRLCL